MNTLWHSLKESLRNVGALNRCRQKHPGVSNIAVSAALVAAICASMLIATPVEAILLQLPDLPTTMTVGSAYSFFAQVDITAAESIPLASFRLDIDGATPAWVVFDVNGAILSQSGAFSSVTPVISPAYGYGSGYASGFGYRPATGYNDYTETWGWGYGYGSNWPVPAPTTAKYQVTLNTAGFTTGSYTARLKTNSLGSGTEFVSQLYNLTLTSSPSSGGNTGSDNSPVTTGGLTGTTDLVIGQNGAVQTSVTLTDDSGKFALDIKAGTILHDENGNALTSFSAAPVSSPPAAPSGNAVVFAYNFGPEGANFNPPLSLTMKYDPANLPANTAEGDLYIAWWNGSKWEMLPSVVDPVNKTVTAKVSHFSVYALVGNLVASQPPTPPVVVPPTPPATPSPAKFTVSGISVAPAAVKPGEVVTASVTVANSGGTQGKYTLTLKVNGIASGTKDVTLAPGASEKVNMSITQNLPGAYTVELGGLTGTFTVSEAAKPPEPEPANYTTLITGILICVGVVSGVLAYFIWRRRHNQVS